MADNHCTPTTSPLSPTSFRRVQHSRSASWSYTAGNTHLTIPSSLNPISSVIREFVPGFGNPSNRTPASSPMSPTTGRPPSPFPSYISSTLVDISPVLDAETNQGYLPMNYSRHRNESSEYSYSTNGISSASSEPEREEDSAANTAAASTNTRTNHTHSHGQDRMEFQGTIKWLEKNLPFVLLLLSRIMWDHRLGILVALGLFGTFFHANSTVKRQVALKDRRLNQVALWTFAFLSGNVFFIYYVFHNQNLHNCLMFFKPKFSHMDVWTVFWCIGITDYIIKMITMALKSVIITLHRRILPFRKRGKYYLLLEHLSQFYRMLVPIPMWYSFFTDYNYGGEYFAFVASIVYLVLKARMVVEKVGEVYGAYLTFRHDAQYGVPASKEQVVEVGNVCPICQEDMTDPIVLKACKHIFCADCISLWFDRERTCPMCRAKVVDDPTWRDGSTASFVQIF